MERPRQRRIRFGQFEADLESGELFQSGRKVHLQAKPFALLAILLEHHGEVVSRQALSKKLWPDTFVQADQGLNAAVRKVRRALRDDAENPRYIETLGSRGYRFVYPLEKSATSASDPKPSSAFATPAPVRQGNDLSPDEEELLDDYLCGRYFLTLQTKAGLNKALEYFNTVTRLDPGSALGYCGLADAHLSRGMAELVNPKEAWELSRTAAARALEIDPNLADVQLPYGLANLYLHYDWHLITESLDRAMKLNPGFSYVYFWNSFLLGVRGDTRGSVEMAKRAKRMEPLSNPMNAALGYAAFFAGDLELASATAKRILELNEKFPFAHKILGWVAESEGRLEAAVNFYKVAADLSNRWPSTLGYLGHAYAISGNSDSAIEVMRELESMPNYVPSLELAVIQLGLGNIHECLSLLNRALDERSHRVFLLKRDPRFDRLRSNEEFARIISKVFGT